MNHSLSSTGTVRYGRNLVSAGIAGIRNGQDAARGDQRLSAIAADAAQRSLRLAVVGACVGLLTSLLIRGRKRTPNAIALGAVGSFVGFAAGFGWTTRNVTSNVVHSTANEIRRTRDQHWLELNPIDYA